MKDTDSDYWFPLCLFSTLSAVLTSAAASAATLTGIVDLPGAPHVPTVVCNACTVQVVQEPNGVVLDEDVTDHEGRYSFKGIPKGIRIEVTSSRSRLGGVLHGWAYATVSKDPMEVDIQLLPPDRASEYAWYYAGGVTAKTGAMTARFVAGKLLREKVPAASVYQFISGAQSANSKAFAGLSHVGILSGKSNRTVAVGIDETETEFHRTKRVLTYTELKDSVPGSLSKPQYFQILGFLTTKAKATGNTGWATAVNGTLSQQELGLVLKNSAKINSQVFGTQLAWSH